MVLTGTEIKSIRAGRVNLQDAYARIENGEAWLLNMHVSPYEQGNRMNVDPVRPRKLLMKRGELHRLFGKLQTSGLTLDPPLDLHPPWLRQAGAGAGPRQEAVRQARGDCRPGGAARGRTRAERATARMTRHLGAHMPIAGGLHKSIASGQAVGCDVVQVFTKSPQQWRARPLTDEDVRTFREAQQEVGIPCVSAHDTYLINPAAADPVVLQRSREAMVDELERAATLGIPTLVMHLGAHGTEPEEAALERLTESVRLALEQTADDGPALLLETTAGQGTCLGHRFEHLSHVLRVDPAPDTARRVSRYLPHLRGWLRHPHRGGLLGDDGGVRSSHRLAADTAGACQRFEARAGQPRSIGTPPSVAARSEPRRSACFSMILASRLPSSSKRRRKAIWTG